MEDFACHTFSKSHGLDLCRATESNVYYACRFQLSFMHQMFNVCLHCLENYTMLSRIRICYTIPNKGDHRSNLIIGDARFIQLHSLLFSFLHGQGSSAFFSLTAQHTVSTLATTAKLHQLYKYICAQISVDVQSS